MFDIQTQGFDKLQRQLKRLGTNARSLGGTRTVPIDKLLTRAFMQQHTPYSSFDAVVAASGLEIETDDDLEEMRDEWDSHIRKVTKFTSWQSMLEAASVEYYEERLFEGV